MTTDPALYGFGAALFAMAAVSYLCRISGYTLMGFIPLTPPVRRGLSALPGCIIVSAILPIADRSGPVAFAALAVAAAVMVWRRSEILALAFGMSAVAALRASGF